MTLDDLTRDLFRMPDDPAPLDHCPGCMTSAAAHTTTYTPHGVQGHYECGFCHWTWATAWWQQEGDN